MGEGNGKGIQKSDRAEIQVDDRTTARVVESLVLRGDISGLNSDEKAAYYIQVCKSLGLNPASKPFAILKLNGKEIMYPERGATDQLAAMHRLNREIIEGPKVIDLAGTKLVYAVCRATHPNGRIETAIATVPLNDPLNCMMKVETKAKRRVTLSILGLGMLDETEIETIQAEGTGRPYLDPTGDFPVHAEVISAAAEFKVTISPEGKVESISRLTLEQATAIILKLDDKLDQFDMAKAERVICGALADAIKGAAFRRHLDLSRWANWIAKATSLEALEQIATDIEKTRKQKYWTTDQAKGLGGNLPELIAARRAYLSETPDGPQGGGAPKPEKAAANDAGPEREAIQAIGSNGATAAQMLRDKLAECSESHHLLNALLKHGPLLGLTEDEGIAIAVERLEQLGKSKMTAANMTRTEINKRGWRARKAAA